MSDSTVEEKMCTETKVGGGGASFAEPNYRVNSVGCTRNNGKILKIILIENISY